MNQDKWNIILENIERQFKVLDRGADENNGTKIEWIEFENPKGRMKLEWVEKPRVMGLETRYSRRAGTSAGNVKQVESKSETVNFVRAYIFSEEKNDWEEMRPTDLTRI